MSLNTSTPVHRIVQDARLPRWLLPQSWPMAGDEPALAVIGIVNGRIASVAPCTAGQTSADLRGRKNFGDLGGRKELKDLNAPLRETIDLQGALVLPGLLEAHAHIDKTYTRSRLGPLQPGLLSAIEATHRDRDRYTRDDLRIRASRALEAAARAGVTRLRTHIDWAGVTAPLAWEVLSELASEWRDRLRLQCIALAPLPLFASRADAQTIIRQIQATPDAVPGGFIHTSNYDPAALDHLLDLSAAAGLDLDLHVDEELAPQAAGLAHIARRAAELRFAGRIVCSHVCALAVKPEDEALSILDSVAGVPITLIALPITNLMLQDAVAGRTPRQRGLTLLKEARSRGIPVLIGSDNVQDAFCPIGTYDPVDALRLAVVAGQLDEPFDVWSQSICRTDWVDGTPASTPSLIGLSGELTVFPVTDAYVWPAADTRCLIRSAAPLPLV
jgi:cytosine deaminase